MGVMGLVSAWCLTNPPAGWKPAGWTPPAPTAAAPSSVQGDYTFGEAIRTPQFWLLYISFFCGAFAGLMVSAIRSGHGMVGVSSPEGREMRPFATDLNAVTYFDRVVAIR